MLQNYCLVLHITHYSFYSLNVEHSDHVSFYHLKIFKKTATKSKPSTDVTKDDEITEITNLFLHHDQKAMTSLHEFRKYFSKVFGDAFKCTLNWFILPHIQNSYEFFDFLSKMSRKSNNPSTCYSCINGEYHAVMNDFTSSPASNSACLFWSSSLCSVKLTYWSSAFLLTWLNCCSCSLHLWSSLCNSLILLRLYLEWASRKTDH